MRKKIFKNMCLLALVTILLSSLLVTIVYYANSDARMKSEVREETRFVRGAVELSGQDYLATVENTANRITLIDTDGTVLYDNQADPATMENHSDREEFQEASTAGAGEATRISDTIAEQTFYYAVKLQNGQVLRVAATTDSVFAAVLAVLPWILGVEVLVAVCTVLFSNFLTKKIVAPINRLDLDHPADNEIYDELSPLLGKISRQNEVIAQQMKSLREKQEEFTSITENMSEGFLVLDNNTDILSYNTSALRLLGAEAVPAESHVSALALNRSAGFRSAVDSALAGALELVNMEDVPVFTIATGHGEMLTLDNMASFISMLEDQNFEVQEIDLLTESIPEGTQVLMLPTPTTDYSEAEVDKLREYLNNTTNPEALTLLATSNPTQGSMPNYEAFLEEWGIRVEEGVVAETNTDRMALADAYGVLVDPSEDYLSGNTYDRLVSYYSAPITKLFDANNGISTYDLWTTSDSAYVVTEDTTEEQAADPDTSSQTVASVSSKYVQVDGSSVTRSLVMFGSSYVFLDTFMSNAFSDGSFVTDLTLYLTGNDGSNVTVLTERVQTNEMDVTATRSTMDMWGIIFSAVIPVAILACGLVIFLKRRHL